MTKINISTKRIKILPDRGFIVKNRRQTKHAPVKISKCCFFFFVPCFSFLAIIDY